MTEPRTYYLPFPISANSRMGVYNGRQLLSTAARKWYEHAGQELGLQRPQAVLGPVELRIELKPPTKRKFDIDNRAKVAIDALVKNGIIEDDHSGIVRKVSIELAEQWDEDVPAGALVTVTGCSE